MTDCNPAKTPLPSNFNPVPATDEEFAAAKHFDYPAIAGSVQYLATIARPDIAYTAGVLCRYMSKWNLDHYAAAKHLLRYLRGTSHLCLTFAADAVKGKRVFMYADASWGNCLETRRSTTGYVSELYGGTAAWRSRRQATVSLSTAEAEYKASSDTTQQALWLKQLISDLEGTSMEEPMTIYNDNLGAIQLSKNPVKHDQSKHIGLRHHFLRENVVSGNIDLQHVPSENNKADILTKALTKDVFQRLRGMIGLGERELTSRGSDRNDT